MYRTACQAPLSTPRQAHWRLECRAAPRAFPRRRLRGYGVHIDAAAGLRELALVEGASSNASGIEGAAPIWKWRSTLRGGSWRQDMFRASCCISDGRATAGDADAALARLIDARIPLFVEPLGPRSLGDTWVDTLEVPDGVAAGASFTASVGIATSVEDRRSFNFSRGTTCRDADRRSFEGHDDRCPERRPRCTGRSPVAGRGEDGGRFAPREQHALAGMWVDAGRKCCMSKARRRARATSRRR